MVSNSVLSDTQCNEKNRELYRQSVIDRKEMVPISHVDKVVLDDWSEQPFTQQFSSVESAMAIVREYAVFPSNLNSVVVMRYHCRMSGVTYWLALCSRMVLGSVSGPHKVLNNGEVTTVQTMANGEFGMEKRLCAPRDVERYSEVTTKLICARIEVPFFCFRQVSDD